MNRAVLLAVALTATACVKPLELPAAKTPEPGLDPAAFDRAVRPQDDLFRHVNGSWLAKTDIPADKASYGAFDILFDKHRPIYGASSKRPQNRRPRRQAPRRRRSATSTTAS